MQSYAAGRPTFVYVDVSAGRCGFVQTYWARSPIGEEAGDLGFGDADEPADADVAELAPLDQETDVADGRREACGDGWDIEQRVLAVRDSFNLIYTHAGEYA